MDKMSILNKLVFIENEYLLKGEYELGKEELEKLKINSLIHYFINLPIEEDKELLGKVLSQLVKVLQLLYNNSGILSPTPDELYDALYEKMLLVTEEDIVGASLMTGELAEEHKYPALRGTLDKLHFITEKERGNDVRKSIEGWKVKCENKLGRQMTKDECHLILYPKFDGISGIFECNPNGTVNRVLSRGDTTHNLAVNLTPKFKGVNLSYVNPNSNKEFGVKTEVVITTDNYKKFMETEKSDYNNQRSAISGITNRLEVKDEFLKYMTIVPVAMQVLGEDITIPDCCYTDFPWFEANLNDLDSIRDGIDKIKRLMIPYGIDIDGIVIRLTDEKIKKELGRDLVHSINKFEAAYKFPPEEKKTTIIDVEFPIGLLGRVTPVVKVKPVKMHGNTVKSISLGSVDMFKGLHIHKGDEAIIKYDIVPYLYKDSSCIDNVSESLIEVPTHCSFCERELLEDPVLKCVNDNCPSRKIGRIINFINKTGIKNISEATVTTLFNKGFLNDIDDLFKLDKFKITISSLPNFGPKLVSNFVESINAHKSLFDWELLGSIGIPNISSVTMQKIMQYYNINELFNLAKKGKMNELTKINGIGEKSVNILQIFLVKNEELIYNLTKILDIKRDERVYSLYVSFTGCRPSKEMIDYMEKHETKVLGSVNNKTHILVVPDGNDKETSSYVKAKMMETPIMEMNDFKEKIGFKE